MSAETELPCVCDGIHGLNCPAYYRPVILKRDAAVEGALKILGDCIVRVRKDDQGDLYASLSASVIKVMNVRGYELEQMRKLKDHYVDLAAAREQAILEAEKELTGLRRQKSGPVNQPEISFKEYHDKIVALEVAKAKVEQLLIDTHSCGYTAKHPDFPDPCPACKRIAAIEAGQNEGA